MHEFSLTTQIVDSVLEDAKNQGAKKVTEVHLEIGKLTFLGIEQVRFSYKVLVEDTIMKDSKGGHFNEKGMSFRILRHFCGIMPTGIR